VRDILIVGGGYAGFSAAWNLKRRLRRDEASITLVEPHPQTTYQPFLPEDLTGSREAEAWS
jgi:NADH dehydrogenase